jgi:hypothetical protein
MEQGTVKCFIDANSLVDQRPCTIPAGYVS